MDVRRIRLLVAGVAAGAVLALTAGVAGAAPTLTITPSSGLQAGTKVHITAQGFTPGKSLGVTFRSDQGTSTGAGDCALDKIVPLTADSAGKVATDFTIPTFPFGASNRTCDATNKCLISVGEQSADPNAERAVSDDLGFGGAAAGTSGTTAGSTARTGLEHTVELIGAGSLLVLLGAMALIMGRRPRTRRA